jgi:NO-binding membrane sensor protein with MHYT domain/DNA-binding LytR/AlgR family response regulator
MEKAMQVTHEPWLVALSLVVAIQGAYVGLSLAVQVADAVGLRRRLLLAGAAISLAVAIWAMHFVGMLAARLSIPVDYLVFPTLLSFLVCVIVVGAAVFAASAGPLTTIRLATSAVFMGGGIVSMHYIGMSALHASAHLTHAPIFVAASVAFAIAASGLALWLAGGRSGRPPLLLSAAALGVAIAGMHYTAMAGLALFPHVSPPSRAPVLSTDLLAIVVAIVAFVVSGIFLLILVPDRSAARATTLWEIPTAPTPRQIEAEPASPQASRINGAVVNAGAEFGQGTYAPLGGAGGPPRRLARHLPVEREGTTQFVAVDDVVAVHANAHYSYIFDGTSNLFCPLAIGDVESRLDAGRFIRVHRSHIVNIDFISGLKWAGDNGVVKLAGANGHTVPVSRSRIGGLKSRLGVKVGDTVP